MADPVNCPHCGEELNFEMVSRLAEQSKFQFCISPAPGERLAASTVANVVLALEKMMTAHGRDHGVKTTLLMDNMQASEDGTMTLTVVAARVERGLKQKAGNDDA